MRQRPGQRQGRRARIAKQLLASPPAAVTVRPEASPAAGSATAAAEGTGSKKVGISAAAGKVNRIGVFIGSDLDGPFGSDLGGKASPTASCWDPTGMTQEI